MKPQKFFPFIILLCICSRSICQDTSYRHELGISFIRRNLGYNSEFTTPCTISFKTNLEKIKFTTRIDVYYSESIFKEQYYVESTHQWVSEPFNYSVFYVTASAGIEKEFGHFKLQPLVGAELSFISQTIHDEFRESEELPEGSFFGPGLSLYAGLQYTFLPKFSVTFECGPSVYYTWHNLADYDPTWSSHNTYWLGDLYILRALLINYHF